MIELNAKITSTMLGKEDHGIPAFLIEFDFDGSGQSAGKRGLRYGKAFMPRFGGLDASEVANWEKVGGT